MGRHGRGLPCLQDTWPADAGSANEQSAAGALAGCNRDRDMAIVMTFVINEV